MDLKVDALRAKYQYEKLEAIATLEVYVKSAVGIGEHPQIIEEMAKLVEQVANGVSIRMAVLYLLLAGSQEIGATL